MIPINTQAMRKREVNPNGDLEIHSIFLTIQGEGPYAGCPAVFIRLAGCNLQCPGCDTEYTRGSAIEPVESIVTRVAMVRSAPNGPLVLPLVVITGGEPFRQNIIPLIRSLKMVGYQVQVETNGTLGFMDSVKADMAAKRRVAQAPDFDIVVSPKAGKVHEDLHSRIIAYKYVVNAGEVDAKDGLPTSVLGLPGRPARPHNHYRGPIYVQAADESVGENEPLMKGRKNLENQAVAIESCMRFGYTLGMQLHKIIDLE
jgi:7-carboxy-7-deazaguanine synthase